MRRNVALVVFMSSVCVLSAAGCKSATEKQLEAEAALVPTPLEVDPLDQYKIAPWWGNGERLLRLDSDSSYALFSGMNRYTKPIENGRWSQQTYAALWLEPYTTARAQPRRITITKIDGKLALQFASSPGVKPMFELAGGPPAVLEDRLIGKWTGALGTIQLGDDLRYTLTPASTGAIATAERPHVFAIRKGTWRIANEQLILTPDVPGIEPLVMPLNVESQKVTIAAPGGTLTR